MSRRLSHVENFVGVVVAVGALTLWGYLSLRIPLNDDEVIQYQPIFCLMYPNAPLSMFAERCESLDLNIFGTWLPLRSYTYLGSASAIFFFPLWWLVHSPVAVRVWTGLLWLLHGYLLARITRIPWVIAVSAAMCAAPVLAQHLVDTGPSALQFVMIQSAVLLCLRALAVQALWKAIVFGAIAGLCAFIVVEQKAFAVNGAVYALYLLVAGYGVREWHGSRIRRLIRFAFFGIFALVVSLPPVYVLLHSMARYGGRYIDVMRNAAHNFSWRQMDAWQMHAWELFQTFALKPAAYFHRNYPIVLVPDYPLNYVMGPCTVLAWVAVGCLILLVVVRRWREAGTLLLSGLLTVIALALVARSKGAWAGHHAIFAHIIPIVGVATALGVLAKRFWFLVIPCICVMLYVNIRPAWTVAHARPADFSDPSRDQLLKILDDESFARDHLVLHLSWGSYFLDSLFGPKSQAVARHKDVSEEVWKLASDNNRRLAVLKIHQPGWDKDPQAKGLHLEAAPTGGTWELWVQD